MVTTDGKHETTERKIRTWPPTQTRQYWTAMREALLPTSIPSPRPYEYFGTGSSEEEAIADLRRREDADGVGHG